MGEAPLGILSANGEMPAMGRKDDQQMPGRTYTASNQVGMWAVVELLKLLEMEWDFYQEENKIPYGMPRNRRSYAVSSRGNGRPHILIALCKVGEVWVASTACVSFDCLSGFNGWYRFYYGTQKPDRNAARPKLARISWRFPRRIDLDGRFAYNYHDEAWEIEKCWNDPPLDS